MVPFPSHFFARHTSRPSFFAIFYGFIVASLCSFSDMFFLCQPSERRKRILNSPAGHRNPILTAGLQEGNKTMIPVLVIFLPVYSYLVPSILSQTYLPYWNMLTMQPWWSRNTCSVSLCLFFRSKYIVPEVFVHHAQHPFSPFLSVLSFHLSPSIFHSSPSPRPLPVIFLAKDPTRMCGMERRIDRGRQAEEKRELGTSNNFHRKKNWGEHRDVDPFFSQGAWIASYDVTTASKYFKRFLGFVRKRLHLAVGMLPPQRSLNSSFPHLISLPT